MTILDFGILNILSTLIKKKMLFATKNEIQKFSSLVALAFYSQPYGSALQDIKIRKRTKEYTRLLRVRKRV